MLLCFALTGLAQMKSASGEGYDPTNPGDPGMQVRLHTESSPAYAGSTSPGNGWCEPNTQQYISAYAAPGWQFVKWVEIRKENGVETETDFSLESGVSVNLTSEGRSFRAYFEYDPDSPGDPEYVRNFHYVNLVATPESGGDFSINVIDPNGGYGSYGNRFRLVVGQSAEITANARENFHFSCWKQNGKIISTERTLTVTMGDENLEYVAQFVYDPSNPGNPRPNKFNTVTGELVVDDFDAGNLWQTIVTTVERETRQDPDKYPSSVEDIIRQYVKSVTVIGRVNGWNDMYVFNGSNFPYVTAVDLSRVTGLDQMDSSCMNGMSQLQTLSLPSCLNSIDAYVLGGCANVDAMYVYATVPPAIFNDEVFRNFPSGMTVYVPAESLDAYKAAQGWGNCILLPMDYKTSSLTVTLPEAFAKEGIFKNMSIVVRDDASSQERRVIVGVNNSYNLTNLLPNVEYSVSLVTSRNQVSAASKITLGPDEAGTVDLLNPIHPASAQLTVLTPGGEDVSSLVSVTWKDTEDKLHYGTGLILDNVLEGTVVKYEVTPGNGLGALYMTPKPGYWTMKKGENPSLTLEERARVELTMRVTEAFPDYLEEWEKGEPKVLPGVGVTTYQDIDGRFGESNSGVTDDNGLLKLSFIEGYPARVTLSHAGHISTVAETDALAPDTKLSFEMKGIDADPWRKVKMTLKHKMVSEADVPNPVKDGYDDINNVSFEAVNVTTGEEVTVEWQNPVLYLLDNVNPGDEVKVTASSLNDKFNDVSATVGLEEKNVGALTLTLTDHGAVRGYYESAHEDVETIRALIYDNTGNLVGRDLYNVNDKFQFEGLPAGSYTLVSIADHRALRSLARIEVFTEDLGLVAGTDFAVNEFTVDEAKITQLKVQTVPQLDDSKFYRAEGSFSVNKTSVVAGGYITFRANYYIPSNYEGNITGINLEFPMPEECSFVEKSLIALPAGTASENIRFENGVLRVPFESNGGEVKFCVEPRKGGQYFPDAFITYEYGGNTYRQPIGSAWFQATDFELRVPATTARTTVYARGTARDVCNITVYDNGKPVGQCLSQPNGDWVLKFELAEPGDGIPYPEYHQIYADIYDPVRDRHYPTASKLLIYDPEYPEPGLLTMIHNGATIDFDHNKGVTNPASYAYSESNDLFTFQAVFEENAERADSVVFVIHASDGSKREMEGVKMPSGYRWACAAGYPDADRLPVNVTLRFVYRKDNEVSAPFENPVAAVVTKFAPDAVPIIDPSGYVYEGVRSNRLEGVKCTVFYREMREDMYGDVYYEVVKWDAEKFAQENPIFTDADGSYRWDVPEGEWQVLFEKDGYMDARSSWLPVPPPQLEVNIPMMRYAQPAVKAVRAFSDGIEIDFDCLMDMVSVVLATDGNSDDSANLIVKDNAGNIVAGVMKAIDEASDNDGAIKVASKFRFVPETTFAPGDVTVIISNRVQSCHGVTMQESYEQTFTIEPEPTEILFSETGEAEGEAMTAMDMTIDSRRKVFIQVLPTEAGAGKTVDLTMLTPGLVEASETAVTLDENGQAAVYLTSILPGGTDVKASLRDYTLDSSLRVEIDNKLLIRGDVNDDRIFSVPDVTAAIAFAMGDTPEKCLFEAADVNRDEAVTISDVTSVIYLVLSQGEAALAPSYNPAPVEAMYSVDGGKLRMSSTLELTAMQFDVTGVDVDRLRLVGGLASTHRMTVGETPEGKLRVVIYSNDNETLPSDLSQIIEVGDCEITNMLLSTSDYRQVRASGTSGIGMIPFDGAVRIHAEGNMLVVDAERDGTVLISTTDGVTVTRRVVAGRNTFALEKGVYAVACDGASAKVVIR